jgi:DNA end-binding protein Ku
LQSKRHYPGLPDPGEVPGPLVHGFFSTALRHFYADPDSHPQARDRGLLGMLLHYPYEVRQPDEYFGDIPAEKAPKEMIELAAHIIDTMAGHFDPEKFNDRYEDAMRELIKRKAAGEKITPVEHAKPKTTVNLMEALRASVEAGGKRPPAPSAPSRPGVRKSVARGKAKRKAAG